MLSLTHTSARSAPTLALLAVLGGAPLTAQGASSVAAPAVFADPWKITFRHVQDAMAGKFANGYQTYYLEQTRRERYNAAAPGKPPQYVYRGVLERLTYRPAHAATKTPPRFKLEFAGLEGRTLSASELKLEADKFAKRAAFTYGVKGFHIADPVRANQVYNLIVLASSKRSTNRGVRSVYRVAVIPKAWDRTAWLLELDTETGYPIYAGEYALQDDYSVALESELIVTSFVVGVRVPNANDPSWWRPSVGIEVMSSASAALKKALTKSTKQVVPAIADLPSGFALEESVVQVDPYTGDRKALLTYTDGVDRIFIRQHNVTTIPQSDDTIGILTEAGMTRCVFQHEGVYFFLVGRAAQAAVRRASTALYDRAKQTL